jgi:hypothetical protein
MRSQVRMWAFVLTVITAGQVLGGERDCCEPPQQSFLQRLHPVGGWHPYGGGLLDWWDPHCFPRCGAPDDYCRKPLPKVCCPAYPSFYIWGPPEVGCPRSSSPRDCNKPHCDR